MAHEEKGEFALIRWIRRRLGRAPKFVAIPSGDDMAGLDLAGEGLVQITTDMLLDGVHFDTATATLRQIGYKSMACSLSDAAAMAALPRAAVASAALPRSFTPEQARELTLGMLDAADPFGCALVGGDVTAWDQPLAVNVALIATESGTLAVRRGGAQPGDDIFVTGTLGGSLVSGRHLSFTPRVAEARALAAAVSLHSMIDLSDGLSSDLNHICDESGVGCDLLADAVPISDAARSAADPLAAALNDGEDFELCFTCSPADGQRLLASPPVQVTLTRVGRITLTRDRMLVDAEGRSQPLVPRGYEHFR
ncbi:MAG: Thiamine-monophosphate kinase [Phycisphaerae bacterium]|nr:Thiamine-monophosphate kinase [Phycisphaerae bacterium]